MTPEQLKGMNGRRVLVEAVIRDPYPEEHGAADIEFPCLLGLNALSIRHSAIREILPEPVKVGDTVEVRGLFFGRVLAVDGDMVGINVRGIAYGTDGYGWEPLSDLTLMEPGQ